MGSGISNHLHLVRFRCRLIIRAAMRSTAWLSVTVVPLLCLANPWVLNAQTNEAGEAAKPEPFKSGILKCLLI